MIVQGLCSWSRLLFLKADQKNRRSEQTEHRRKVCEAGYPLAQFLIAF